MRPIEINGHYYQEADHGRFEASLISNGEEIARTEGDAVIWFGGCPREDVEAWADSFDIERIEER